MGGHLHHYYLFFMEENKLYYFLVHDWYTSLNVKSLSLATIIELARLF